jgi:hypothetical protein
MLKSLMEEFMVIITYFNIIYRFKSSNCKVPLYILCLLIINISYLKLFQTKRNEIAKFK